MTNRTLTGWSSPSNGPGPDARSSRKSISRCGSPAAVAWAEARELPDGDYTVRVRAVFDNADGRLIPGQFARLEMGQPKTEPALTVNERAVGTDQSKRFVLVEGGSHHSTMAVGLSQYREALGELFSLR